MEDPKQSPAPSANTSTGDNYPQNQGNIIQPTEGASKTTQTVLNSPTVQPDIAPQPGPIVMGVAPIVMEANTPPVNNQQTAPPATAMVPSGGFSKSDLENDLKREKKQKRLIIMLSALTAIILLLLGGFGWWYESQDHSIYSKLYTVNYNENGYIFSISIPQVMQPNQAALNADLKGSNADAGPLVFYEYVISQQNKQVVVLTVSHFDFSGVISPLDLTTAQLINQIKNGSGSFINALNSQNPNAYSVLFSNCNTAVQNSAGQTGLQCTVNVGSSYPGYHEIHVIGFSGGEEYAVTLVLPKSIWNQHQKVWQKVEKSFIYG